MSRGWIKLHRKILDSAVWEQLSPEHIRVFITILLSVNAESKTWIWQGEKYTCHPGELITSVRKLSEMALVTERNVRTSLKKLEILEVLEVKTTQKATHLKVNNWQDYQSTPDTRSDKQVTNKCQTSDKQVTTTKEIRTKNKELRKNIQKKTTSKSSPIFSESDPENIFQEFWDSYPRKEGKTQATKAFNKQYRATSPDKILSSLKAQKLIWERLGTEIRYIPHASTWLNQQRFLDQLEPPPDNPVKPHEEEPFKRKPYTERLKLYRYITTIIGTCDDVLDKEKGEWEVRGEELWVINPETKELYREIDPTIFAEVSYNEKPAINTA